ncbi:hypothetical protein LXL04_021971 [Taraxacum kok-saghyz]
MAMTLWVNIAKWWDIDIPVCSNMQEWVIWLDGVRLRSGVKRCSEVVCLTTMWVMWGYRNKLLFDSVKPMTGHIWDSIQVYSYFWIDSRVSKFKVSRVDWLCNPEVAINILSQHLPDIVESRLKRDERRGLKWHDVRVGAAIPDPTRNPTRTQPENKRVWVLISDPPTRQPANLLISRVGFGLRFQLNNGNMARIRFGIKVLDVLGLSCLKEDLVFVPKKEYVLVVPPRIDLHYFGLFVEFLQWVFWCKSVVATTGNQPKPPLIANYL